jgi:hypothetical protein
MIVLKRESNKKSSAVYARQKESRTKKFRAHTAKWGRGISAAIMGYIAILPRGENSGELMAATYTSYPTFLTKCL